MPLKQRWRELYAFERNIMNNLKKVKLNLNATIKEALQIIDGGAMQIAVVVDDKGKLLGTVTDGDIRRGLLNGFELNSPITTVMFTTPTIAKINDKKKDVLKIALNKKLRQIPIINDEGIFTDIIEIEELIKPKEKTNNVILMVGGLGTRMHPLTENIPKPMLKIGNKSILESIVEKFVKCGYYNIIMCVNYKYEVIKEYFGNGNDFGAKIEYVIEKERMGTAGALSLLKEIPKEPFFVMNGDLLSDLNFNQLHDFYLSNNADAVMCVKKYDFQVPYGVVNIKNSKILSIQEKPKHSYYVNAGIYMLNPEICKYVPPRKFYDMTTLFSTIINEKKVISFPLRENWLDIGGIKDYEKASKNYKEAF